MKNTTLFGFALIILLLVGYFLFFNTIEVSGTTGNIVNNGNSGGNSVGSGDAQKITLGTRNYNYFPSVIDVKAGLPVEITLDDSVKGCLRSFSIRDLGISKYARTSDDKIVFTPTQVGSFKFSCSMGMGYGTMNVG